jgi:hypothetical protein
MVKTIGLKKGSAAMSDEDINDEVLFWQKLIEWWRTNQDSPVPERMYLALILARPASEDATEDLAPERVRH